MEKKRERKREREREEGERKEKKQRRRRREESASFLCSFLSFLSSRLIVDSLHRPQGEGDVLTGC